MNRSDLIEHLAYQKCITVAVAEKVVQEIFGSMADTLVSGNRIEIRGFGSFEIREYQERAGRNPKSGVLVSVPTRKRPFFKVGRELKVRILDA